MTKPLALIVGVGASTGQALARAWAPRYRLCLVARSAALVDTLATELADATSYTCDVADQNSWAETLLAIKRDHGLPARILINVESAAWGAYQDLSLPALAKSFEVNVVSVLQLVQVLYPAANDIPPDTRLMVSSSPAAYNPPPRFLGLAPSRVAQRTLVELLDQTLREHGLNCCVFSIDGAIDQPSMRTMLPDQPDEYFLKPAAIAAAMEAAFAKDVFPRRSGIRGASAFGNPEDIVD